MATTCSASTCRNDWIGDFAFYEWKIAEAYLFAGFGRIETIPASTLANS